MNKNLDGIDASPEFVHLCETVLGTRDYGRVAAGLVAHVLSVRHICENAHRIYAYLAEHNLNDDSVVREAAFQYASITLNVDYEHFWDAWLGEKPLYFSRAYWLEYGENNLGLNPFESELYAFDQVAHYIELQSHSL